jgi:hypothetical protein
VGAGDGRVCDEIGAYREKAAREQRAMLVTAGLLKPDTAYVIPDEDVVTAPSLWGTGLDTWEF